MQQPQTNCERRRRSTSLATAQGIAVLVLLLLGSAVSNAADFIWIEGESSRDHGMRGHNWYDSVTKDALSGGDWLSHFAQGERPEAHYTFEAPKTGAYDFWLRANPVAGARLSYRLDRGRWQSIDVSRTVGQLNIATDGKPDMRFIAWIHVGSLELERGEHSIRFRFESANQNHGAIDCFVLSETPFRPRGVLKPGERSGLSNPGFYAWEPETDAFTADALVDLRSLNEDVAGEKGRVRRDGAGFVLGSGDRVRFWATNAGPGIWELDHASHVYLARRLAKCGVNMVRLHGALYRSRDAAVDRKRLDDLHHLVHALKEEGIYTSLSFFFPLWFELDPGQRSFMVLFFDDEMQRIYFDWAKKLLATPNPYTKIPLGKDPAVAIVEVVNEDSHFFWTFARKNASDARWRKLQSQFAAWLTRKHGSLDRAYTAWGGARMEDDAPNEGRIDLYDAWHMTADGIRANPKLKARISDQVRFLTENMRSFYERAITRFRDDGGYEGLVSCGNWHVADPSTLDALERYAYTAGDVIDHHGYFDRGHEGEASGWSVRPGHQFESVSALFLEESSPIPFVETNGHPHIVSEIGWPNPNRYRAEFPFLAAAYGALQGIDGVFSFALGGAGWDEQIEKFAVSTPVILGSFPALALAFRRGDIEEGPVVVEDVLDLEKLFALEGTPVHASAAFDRLRAPSEESRSSDAARRGSFDPLSFYVGRVARTFGSRSSSTEKGFSRVDPQELIDRGRKTIRSATGELTWDYGRGLVTLSAPRAAGAVGFLGRAGTIELGGVSIETKNDYASVVAISLDGQPIAQSERILIQCLTIEAFYGFRATGEKSLRGRIESLGSAPIGVERNQVEVTLRLEGEQAATVRACDEHGYPREVAVKASPTSGALKIVLDEASPYHVVTRRKAASE